MLIEKVEMKNYLSHKNSEIGFSTGVNIIIGKNGAGKSSVVDAVRLALFGSSDMERRIVSYRETEATVKFRFRHNSHEYEIIRIIENKRGKENTKRAIIYRDGVRLGEGVTEVNQAVERELEMGRTAFINSVYVKQGDIDRLITSTPAQRKDVMSEIIGLKDYERALKNLDPILKNLEFEIRDFPQKKDQIKKIEEDLGQLKENLRISSEKIDELNVKRGDLERLKDQLNGKMGEFRKIREYLSGLEKNLAALEMEIRKKEIDLDLLKKEELEFIKMKKELDELQSGQIYIKRNEIRRILSLMKDMEKIENDLKELQSGKEENQNNKKRLSELEPNYIQYVSNKEKISSLQGEIERYEEENKNFERQKGASDNMEKRISEMEERRELLKSRLRDRIAIDKINEEDVQQQVEKLRDEIRRSGETKSEENANISQWKIQKEEMEEKVRQLMNQSTCPLCGREMDDHTHGDILQSYRQKIEELIEKINSSENHINALSKKIKKSEDLLNVMDSRDLKDYFQNEKDLEKWKKELDENHKNLERLKEFNRKYMEIKGKIDSLRHEMEKLNQPYTDYIMLKGKVEGFDEKTMDRKISEKMMELEKIKNEIEGMGDSRILVENGVNENEIRKVEEQIEKIARKIQSSDLQSRITRIATELDNTMGERDRLKNEKLEMEEKLGKEDEVQGELSRVNAKYREIVEQLNGEIEKRSGMNSEIEQKKRMKQELEEDVRNGERKNRQYEFLSNLRRAISRDGIPKALRGMAVESISAQARNIISRFNLSIEDVSLSDDLDVEVMQDGSVKDISQLSGGERTALAIGIRLAIARYLGASMNTIIMDEPTVFLDEERRSDLRDIIKYSIKELSEENIFPQIIIITHHEELETAADIVYEIKKERGVSEIEIMR